METYSVNTFQAGIFDDYLNPLPHSSYKLDNVLLDDTGQPYTRSGTVVFTTAIPTSSGSTKSTGIYLGSAPHTRPFIFRGPSVYSLNETNGFTEILGPVSNSAVPNKTALDYESVEKWKKQLVYTSSPSTVLPQRIYCSSITAPAAYTALTLGLPALVRQPVVTGTATGFNYVYAFHYSYTFTDYAGTQFQENSNVTPFISVTNNADPSGTTIAITGIPVLANTASTNYDVTNVKVNIFRTINNGTTLYFVAQIGNGTTTYNDSISDATIKNNATIYTTGGVLGYDQPPVGSFYCTQVNDFFWYATDRLVTHSVQGAPGASPALYQFSVDQKIVGLDNIISFPILFCDKSIYRLDGTYDAFGNGGFALREISQTAGCVSNRSVVAVPGGLVWAGNAGFYFTDGYQVQKISQGINYSYQTWKNSTMVGKYDSNKNIVYWTVAGPSSGGFSATDMIACLHLNFGITAFSTFTTMSFRGNFSPSTIGFSESQDVDIRWQGKLLIADARGFFLWQDDASFTDPQVSTWVTPASFPLQTVIYKIESPAINFNSDSNKYMVELFAKFQNNTDLSVQFQCRKNIGGPWTNISEYRVDGGIIWGLSNVVWNSPTDTQSHDWNSMPPILGYRYFPSQKLRAPLQQLRITNSLTWIARSDDLGLATTDTVAKTITLDNVANSWPDNPVGYWIYFASDGYVQSFYISASNSSTQIVVTDPYSLLPAGDLKWMIQGYRKNERMSLMGYTIKYELEETNPNPTVPLSTYVNAGYQNV